MQRDAELPSPGVAPERRSRSTDFLSEGSGKWFMMLGIGRDDGKARGRENYEDRVAQTAAFRITERLAGEHTLQGNETPLIFAGIGIRRDYVTNLSYRGGVPRQVTCLAANTRLRAMVRTSTDQICRSLSGTFHGMTRQRVGNLVWNSERRPPCATDEPLQG